MLNLPDLPNSEDVASLPPEDILDLAGALFTCHPGLYALKKTDKGFVCTSRLFPQCKGVGRKANDSLWALESSLQSFMASLLNPTPEPANAPAAEDRTLHVG